MNGKRIAITVMAALLLALPGAWVGEGSTSSTTPGQVVAWGNNWYGVATVPAGLSDVIAIAAGGYHNLVLRSNGTVVAWGSSYWGQATVPAGLSDVTALDAGDIHSLALRSDGTVVAWGYDSYGQATVPAGLSDVTAIAAGGRHSLALRSDGTVVAWGWNDDGQATVPVGLSDVTAIAAGGVHSLALVVEDYPVVIDIKPGNDENAINPKNKGVIPVAILTTDDFDATTVDPLSIRFGPGEAQEVHGIGHIEDVDGNGDMDMMLHFETRDSGIQCGDTSATLTGMTYGEQQIIGSDSIRTVGCR
jgi:hypothetical protein